METQAAGTREASPAERSRVIRGASAVLLCVLVVLAFYVRAALSYGKSIGPQPNPAPVAANFQNQIANGLLARKLSLEIEAPKALLSLPDPYDPLANAQYRVQGLHDYSLYKGKLYSYFGPAPAILLYIPFRILRVGALSPTLAAFVFGALGFAFSLALFRLLVRWSWGSIPVWMHCAAVFTLGLGVPVAWMIYIGRDYEATIACGYMLLFAGLYLIARGALAGRNVWCLAAGSGALAFAVAARPTLAAAGLFVVVAAVYLARAGMEPRRRNFVLVALIAPYVAIGLLLAWYNYARFDSIVEFGQSYQLAALNPRTYPFRDISYVPRGLYYYLFSPGRVLGAYPYLFLRESTYDVNLVSAGRGLDKYMNEPVAGVFTNMPVAIAGYLLLLTRVRGITRRQPRIIPTIGVLVIPAALMLLLISYQFQSATMRYELDFAPLIVLGSLLGWVAWNRSCARTSMFASLGNALWLVALASSIAFNIAITLTPCQGTGSC